MAGLVVVSNPALADGFRLAGATTIVAAPGDEVVAALRGLVSQAEMGLVLVTDDLWGSVPPRLRGALENLAQPVVIGLSSGSQRDASVRRRLLGEMLERAIGYRVQLAGGNEP